MPPIIEKVTAFITRPSADGRPSAEGHDLLLFEHPYAGIQIPAGTVEEGETPEAAAFREAFEETGLDKFSFHQHLGSQLDPLPEGKRITLAPAKIYARPDLFSFNWATLPRGTVVDLLRRADGFSQVSYQEHDRQPDPQYLSMQITGFTAFNTRQFHPEAPAHNFVGVFDAGRRRTMRRRL